jgi:hypothetical protein
MLFELRPAEAPRLWERLTVELLERGFKQRQATADPQYRALVPTRSMKCA